MNIVTTISEWNRLIQKNKSLSLGFVPTMGNLHKGHLTLCQRSKKENDLTLVSIFINPMQFDNENDFKNYPKTLDKDIGYLIQENIDYLFIPKVNELYSNGYEIKVEEIMISQMLEGKCRPGHFAGMLTIILKLFNLIKPSRAYFGEKDYQQLLLIKKLVKQFFLPVEVIAVPTVRDNNGLALSSRNNRLSSADKLLASNIFQTISSQLSIDEMKLQLIRLGFKVDYIEEKWKRRLIAVRLNDIRLIDNIPI